MFYTIIDRKRKKRLIIRNYHVERSWVWITEEGLIFVLFMCQSILEKSNFSTFYDLN